VTAPASAPLRNSIVALLTIFFLATAARCEDDAVSSAVAYCARYRQTVHLSDDRKILCFEGHIKQDLDMGPFRQLEDGGLFVIRSTGGHFATAMEMSDLLRDKNATVVIHGYCLSACANYVLVATERTYVLKSAIVAWHGAPSAASCNSFFRGNEQAIDFLETYCDQVQTHARFFAKRGISPGFAYGPQTLHTRNMVKIYLAAAADKRSIFWMWNPKNYRDYFKGRITFESYPASQYEVDEILNRLRLSRSMRAVYDPDD
jgi:hypothetical protein